MTSMIQLYPKAKRDKSGRRWRIDYYVRSNMASSPRTIYYRTEWVARLDAWRRCRIELAYRRAYLFDQRKQD